MQFNVFLLSSSGRPHFRIRKNLNKTELDAITKIKYDENTIIREADKGSAVVMMDREYYKSLCLTVQENDIYYEKQQAYMNLRKS